MLAHAVGHTRKIRSLVTLPTLWLLAVHLCLSTSFHPIAKSRSRSAHHLPSHYNATASHDRCMVKLLLFGDSLTEGYHSHGMRFHPYANKLEELLEASFPVTNTAREDDARRIVAPFLLHQRGVSGEFTDEMVHRLEPILEHAAASGHPYDIVCILGGTNDLSDPRNEPAHIFGNLRSLYEQVHAHNANATVLAITIPQSFVRERKYLETRAAVNQLIRQYAAPRVLHLDLEGAIAYYESEGHVNRIFWDDGLHLTPKGYDFFGQLVFEALRPVVPLYLAAAAAAPSLS